MFPVPEDYYFYVDISKECNRKYKSLLLVEYRFTKSIQNKIRKNTTILYNLKIKGQKSALTNGCNNFLLLEELYKEYK